MEFKHKEIDQLHVSDVTFRSKSSDSLRRSDLNELDPFGIKIDRHPSYNGRYRAVCDVEVKSTTSKASNIKVGSIEGNFDNFIPILFDHLDKNDGAKIRIHHTGSERIEICGKVVGISKIVRRLW